MSASETGHVTLSHYEPATHHSFEPGDPAVVLNIATTGHKRKENSIVQISACLTETLATKIWTFNTRRIESTPEAFAEHKVTLEKTERSFDINGVWHQIEEFL